uniref:Uncharacterized protein n=1 Tax=Arundo donax TaxID=35708 RepID=A0A0A9BCZ5_ARUDO
MTRVSAMLALNAAQFRLDGSQEFRWRGPISKAGRLPAFTLSNLLKQLNLTIDILRFMNHDTKVSRTLYFPFSSWMVITRTAKPTIVFATRIYFYTFLLCFLIVPAFLQPTFPTYHVKTMLET